MYISPLHNRSTDFQITDIFYLKYLYTTSHVDCCVRMVLKCTTSRRSQIPILHIRLSRYINNREVLLLYLSLYKLKCHRSTHLVRCDCYTSHTLNYLPRCVSCTVTTACIDRSTIHLYFTLSNLQHIHVSILKL